MAPDAPGDKKPDGGGPPQGGSPQGDSHRRRRHRRGGGPRDDQRAQPDQAGNRAQSDQAGNRAQSDQAGNRAQSDQAGNRAPQAEPGNEKSRPAAEAGKADGNRAHGQPRRRDRHHRTRGRDGEGSAPHPEGQKRSEREGAPHEGAPGQERQSGPRESRAPAARADRPVMRAHTREDDHKAPPRESRRRGRPPREREQRDDRTRNDEHGKRAEGRDERGPRWSQPPPSASQAPPSEPQRRSVRPPGPPVFLAPTAAPSPPDPDTAVDLTPWSASLDRGELDGTLFNVVTVHVARTQRSRDYDAGDNLYARGESVAVEGEGGSQAVGVVTHPCRRQMCRHRMPRVLRRISEPEPSAEPRWRRREKEVFRIARHIAGTLNLPIKIVRAEAEPNGKIVVYFASEERIDFRELHRRVSAAAQGRIELRQMGVRDAAKVLGGCGPCGLQLCCTSFLREFAPVSIKMAKEQGLVLNPSRVSGLCGRLLCCLTYEDNLYRTQRKLLPKLGKRVVTPKGPGKVKDVDVLAQNIRVILESGEIAVFKPTEVSAMFPSQQQGAREPRDHDDARDTPDTSDSGAPAEGDKDEPEPGPEGG